MDSALPRQALQSASQQNTCSLHVDRTNHLSFTSGQEKPPVQYYILDRTNQPGGGGEDNSCAMEAEDTPGASGPCVLF